MFIYPETGRKSFSITYDNLLEMLSVLPPIFVLLGLLDVWVKRETMIKYMGAGSSFKGALLAFLMGAAAAGPLYAAFPIAGLLLKKGARFYNVLIFIGAWSTMKIPMLLFEITSLGIVFAGIRFGCNIIGIIVIALITQKMLSKKETEEIYANAEKISK